MIQISCTINHKPVQVEVEEGETLMAMLRRPPGPDGTKRGCEVGEWRRLHRPGGRRADGYLPDSWQGLADGKDILTIEGLANGLELSPIQQAFVDCGAIQCGFCTPGMVLSAYALILRNHRPSGEEIRKSLSGNFCRCSAYVQIIDAVQTAAVQMFPEG